LGATQLEVWFGEISNLAQVYTGSLITSFSLAPYEPLEYSTEYGWQVKGMNDTCSVPGTVWKFTTMQDPNLVVDTLFYEDFEGGTGNWTITNDGGTCEWEIFDPPYPNSYTLPATSSGSVMAADADACGSGTTLLSTVTLSNPIDATLYETVWLEFDNDWQAIDADDFCYVDVSTDGGTTWQNVLTFDETDVRNTHEVWDMTWLVAHSTFSLRFVSIQPGWDWWWVVDNVLVHGSYVVPVELSSFTASTKGVDVELIWTTATEINNQGFEIERKIVGGSFKMVGYVAGYGTTLEPKAYSFEDSKLETGNYTYRLKQIDLDGSFTYSEEISVEVEIPLEFALEQNYPNPFNPSTIIKYSTAEDGFVKLSVYNLLGEEVASLVNENQKAGRYEVTFNAANYSSGIYLYRLEISNYSSIKKMLLVK
jgi:hypothetical protein